MPIQPRSMPFFSRVTKAPMTSFMAYTRYFMMAFPVFLVLGDLLGRERWRVAAWIVLGILLGLQVVLTVRHINFIWAG